MFVGITNTPRDYAWGSTTAIAELLGHEASGRPEAELWLGAHPGSPAVVTSGSTAANLAELVGENGLPFLLKVLAAEHPLSLQAHPTLEQAAIGFARENELGIPVDAPNRNYRDALHKPEIIFALTPFAALCGFRDVSETRATIDRLLQVDPGDPAIKAWMSRLDTDNSLRSTFEWLVSRGDGVAELVDAVVAASASLDGDRFSLVGSLASAYPGDPGIVVSLMLNLVTLSPGEVLYLPAGNIHAYVHGLGIELMAASDNVLRGGLTPKHVDVPELLSVLDFSPVEVPYLAPSVSTPGVSVFAPPIPDFALTVVTPTDTPVVVDVAGPAIALCTSGAVTLDGVSADGEVDSAALERGAAVFVPAGSRVDAVGGAGTVFVATAGRA